MGLPVMPTAALAAVVPKTLRDDLMSSRIPWHAAFSDDPDWVDVTDLLSATAWRSIAANYQRACGFKRTAPAAACGLQHYAGRYAGTVITSWAASSHILPSQHSRWKALINSDGETQHVYCDSLPATQPEHAGRPPEGQWEPDEWEPDQWTQNPCAHGEQAQTPQPIGALAHSLVQHFGPIVEACRAANQITARLAWGCIAASCAGAFGHVYRSVATAERHKVIAAAGIAGKTIEAQVDDELISWLDVESSGRLHHNRHTCCLMRLGHNKQACIPCPDITELERSTRRANIASPAVLPPLHWAGQL